MSTLIDYPEADSCFMYLVRHGATPHNLLTPPRLQGSGVDESLSEVGREQAGRVAELLASRPLASIYSSPMKRAVETAHVIASRHRLDVSTFDTLREIDVGRWEGRTWGEIEAEDPEAYALFMEDPGVHGYPDGENLESLIGRVTETLAVLMADHVGKEIAVVAHSVVIRTYMGTLLGLDPRAAYHVPAINCSLSVVRWRRGRAKPVTLNAVGHLM